jgi:hypothetical protein
VHHFAIPSEYCPYCGTKDGSCRMVVHELETVRKWGLKVDDKDLRSALHGVQSPNYREAYTVHGYVCLKGKGNK